MNMPTLESTVETTVAPVSEEANGHAPKAPAKAAKAKKPAAKKAPAKAGKGEAAKASKPVKGKKEKAAAAPRAKKDGLRKPQVRILKALSKGHELSRAQIAEKAPVDVATCVEYIGSDNPATRKANDAKHFPSLLTLGYVKVNNEPLKLKDGSFSDTPGPSTYTITAAGKKAIEKADA